MITPLWGLTNNPKMGTIISHPKMGTKENVVKEQIVYVKGRLDSDLHKELKAIAKQDKRSIVYLLNEAVKLLVEKHKSAKA